MIQVPICTHIFLQLGDGELDVTFEKTMNQNLAKGMGWSQNTALDIVLRADQIFTLDQTKRTW
jgi:hypothetical protein